MPSHVPEESLQLLEAAMTMLAKEHPDAQIRRLKMFGHPCAFVNENMFIGTFDTGLTLRLPEDARIQALQTPHINPFNPLGKRMREYVVFESTGSFDPESVLDWVRASFHYVHSLPPKVRKPRTPKKSSAS